MICSDRLIERLERVFNRVQVQRMQGVPILNPALRVQGVGFAPWQQHCLGILITPWFMNLMLLSDCVAQGGALPVGAKLTHRFPSGAYEFILGDEEGLGRYQMCSLFSPVLQFADQPAAVATAQAVLAGLMDTQNRDETDMREGEIERIWRGDGDGEPSGKETPTEAGQTLTERLEQPVSRRGLLRGNLR